ncbi:MAG: hypothetical protein NTY98_04145 [Verrucomicrobia bacterium]|nr:hypothetical protein [Verrucomicrobiota bacterium]
MKYAPLVASILLGLLFVTFAILVLFNLIPAQEFPKDTPIFHFMAAFGPTGHMKFVKVFELLGGILLLVPQTRNLGLLCLGPIILNILAFHHFVAGDGIFNPILIVISLLALYLLWSERTAWAGLLR